MRRRINRSAAARTMIRSDLLRIVLGCLAGLLAACQIKAPDAPFTTPAYLYYDPFHEPFTFFAWAAALTSRIELMTCVVVLPQRQIEIFRSVSESCARISCAVIGFFLLHDSPLSPVGFR